jgi:SanA protein
MWKKKRRSSLLFLFILGMSLLSILAIYFSNRTINKATLGLLYTSVEAIPHNKSGLLLGTGKYLSNGSINPFYQNRIIAAAELLKSGKIRYLVISGDNSRKGYSEPEDMRADLIAQGIDSTCIYLDYAGFRTFDSVVRLKKIFGQDSVTIISQPFHNQRAIYIAQKEGIAAIGYNAKDVTAAQGLKTNIREKFARVKVFVDFAIGKQPHFLGEKIIIP